MAASRLHAFAEGLTFAAPERLSHLPSGHPQRTVAEKVWGSFRQAGTISEQSLLGADAWAINLLGDLSNFTLGAYSVVRGIVRIERFGHLHIADHCYLGDDVIISAHVGIDIESDVLVAHGVQIFDNISHPINADERAKHYRAILKGDTYNVDIPAAPIVIEKSTWIGFNSIIMKGVRVGARSIVAAGSVVVNDVAKDSFVAGNPARPVRQPT